MAWLSGWGEKRIKLTIDQTKIDTANQSDFPVMVNLSTTSGIGSVDVSAVFDELTSDANRKKIAVTSSDGTTELYVEIELWDDANEIAILHVKIPSVAYDADTDLYLYYDALHADNTTYIGDTTDAVVHNVWDANFVGVWHMAQDPNGDVANAIKDSTVNANEGTPAGTMLTADLVDGKVGKGIDFDGGDDQIDIPHTSALAITAALTVEACVKISALDAYSCICSKQNLPNYPNYEFRLSGGMVRFTLRDGAVQKGNEIGTVDLRDNVFHHVVGVYDNTNLIIYYDSINDGSSVSDPPGSSSSDLSIGVRANGAGPSWEDRFEGIIDEVRISDTERSAPWIKATYHSLWDTLITFGAEETSSSSSSFSISSSSSSFSISSSSSSFSISSSSLSSSSSSSSLSSSSSSSSLSSSSSSSSSLSSSSSSSSSLSSSSNSSSSLSSSSRSSSSSSVFSVSSSSSSRSSSSSSSSSRSSSSSSSSSSRSSSSSSSSSKSSSFSSSSSSFSSSSSSSSSRSSSSSSSSFSFSYSSSSSSSSSLSSSSKSSSSSSSSSSFSSSSSSLSSSSRSSSSSSISYHEFVNEVQLDIEIVSSSHIWGYVKDWRGHTVRKRCTIVASDLDGIVIYGKAESNPITGYFYIKTELASATQILLTTHYDGTYRGQIDLAGSVIINTASSSSSSSSSSFSSSSSSSSLSSSSSSSKSSSSSSSNSSSSSSSLSSSSSSRSSSSVSFSSSSKSSSSLSSSSSSLSSSSLSSSSSSSSLSSSSSSKSSSSSLSSSSSSKSSSSSSSSQSFSSSSYSSTPSEAWGTRVAQVILQAEIADEETRIAQVIMQAETADEKTRVAQVIMQAEVSDEGIRIAQVLIQVETSHN